MKKEYIAGLLLLLAIAYLSQFLSELVVAGGKHPLEASAIAVVIGILLRNVRLVPARCEDGVKTADKILIYGIVLLGSGLTFQLIAEQGIPILSIIVVTMLVGFFLIFALARLFNLSDTLSVLLAAGTTICGTSAIAIVAPLIKAKDSETSYAIGTVALFGLLAIFVYPELGHLVGASDISFGVFAGTAIHSTPQVVGAGFIYSDLAGQTATAVKLVRNCFMAPIAMVLAIWYSRKDSDGAKINLEKAFPWFLFGYFIMAFLSSKGYFTKQGIDTFTNAGKFMILIGMAGVGLSTQLSAFKDVGVKPLLIGFLGSVIVAVVSGVMIQMLL